MKTIHIYKVLPDANTWAPTGPEFTFQQGGDWEAYCTIKVPDAWFLVGDPPLLVCRTGSSSFTSRTATEAFYHAVMRAEGFIVEAAPDDVSVEQASDYYRISVDVVRHEEPKALPSSNGKANLPAKKKR